MKRYILLTILTLILPAMATAEETLRERIYLQTDKALYLAGERVWLKAIATGTQGRPLDRSKVAYVELLDESAPRVQLKIEMADGIGEGSLLLPVTLPTGYYRLVAYTRYMRNEGEAVYYDRLLPVVNTFMPLPAITPNAEADTPHTEGASEAPTSAASPSIKTDRAVYPTRTAGELRIDGLPADLHSLSVSIAGIDTLTASAAASPAATAEGIEAWKRGLSKAKLPPISDEELLEYEGHIVRGRLVDLSTGNTAAGEKPIALLGFVGEGVQVFGGKVEESGEVSFFTRRSGGIHEMATTVVSASPSRYRVDIESPFALHTYAPLPALRLEPGGDEALLRRSVGIQALQYYMAGSAGGADDGGALFSPGEADWRYLLDEYTRFTTMAEVVTEFIPGLRFRKIDDGYALAVLTEERAGFTQGRSMLLLDGIPLIDHSLIYDYNPLLVKEVEVYKGRYVFGGAVFDGLAVFKTYRGDYPGLSLSGSTQLFTYEGTEAGRPFNFPAYRTEGERDSRLPDHRHTLLWMPEVDTSAGRALIPFTTSDVRGPFLIRLEGLTRGGEVVSKTLTIQVE
jgi:hypothetical protein